MRIHVLTHHLLHYSFLGSTSDDVSQQPQRVQDMAVEIEQTTVQVLAGWALVADMV